MSKPDKIRKPTAEEVRKMLSYDPKTGILRWKVERYRKHVGDVAGCIYTSPRGYRAVNVSVNYYRCAASRIIWLLVKGVWPTNEIDHIDNDGTNNRWNNLRDVTHSQNGKNLKLKKNNKTGVAGVHWSSRRKRYVAKIWTNGKETFLGYFDNVKDAKVVREKAVLKYHGEFGNLT